MPKGFFFGSDLKKSTKPVPTVPYCGACGLHKHCHSPKMKAKGKGRKKILLIGDMPSSSDDDRGAHFTGKTGEFLRRKFRKYGVSIDTETVKTNAIICHNPKGVDESQIEHCRPNLIRTVERFNPEVIIPFGTAAVSALLGHYWKNDVGSINRWAGFRIPFQKLNAWVCPTFHPDVVRKEDPKRSVTELLFDRHLEEALDLDGRPWNPVPDYKSQITVIHDPTVAAKRIRWIVRQGGLCAWDYEANMLKPDGSRARIVSCSICWEGKRTIAYPWKGEAITATQEFLKSPLPKIASNLKFEDRWTRTKLGHGVRNWAWDTMLAAHITDNRPGITSIKFQSMVWLGSESWNEHIEPFLRSNSSQDANAILREISPDDLLLYNGLDSLLEFLVAIKQMEYLKHERPN